MSIKFKKENKVRVSVKGAINDERGHPVKFSFVLLCTRLVQEEIDRRLEDKDLPINEFLSEVVLGWEDVYSEENERVEFSPDAFAELLNIPSMRVLCLQAYLKEVGAVAKN